MANTYNDQLVADALKSFREQANALAGITQSLGKTLSQTSSTISKALGDIKSKTSKEQKDNHEINELTFKNKAIEQERNNRKNNNKPLTSGEKESEGWTASGIRTGINTGMNESFSAFLNGDATSNQLIKGIFHSVQAQLQKQFVELLSETATNSIMNIITPITNSLDQYNPIEPLFESIQSKASELGEMFNTSIIEPLMEEITGVFSTITDSLTGTLQSIFDGVGSFFNGNSELGGENGLFGNITQQASIAKGAISSVTSAKAAADTTITASATAAAATTEATGVATAATMTSAFAPAAATTSVASFGTAALIGLAALMTVMAAVKAFASGGHVRGIGTETSDSIPAMLSNNEFVTRAAVVKQPGMLPLLHDINNRGLSAVNDYARRVRHSTGGVAGSPASLSSASFGGTSFNENGSSATTVENAVNLHVYDDPQRIINSSFSDGGMESYYLKVERNPQRLRSILGV